MIKRQKTIRDGDILQIRFGSDDVWMDYSYIRAGEEGVAAKKVDAGIHPINLDGKLAEFRIVRKFMGSELIRGPRV